MNLKFEINKELLLSSLLFNERKESKNLFVDVKNKLWEKYELPYRHFLKGNDYRSFFVNPSKQINELRNHTLAMLDEGIQSEEFKEILSDTEKYKNWLEREYAVNKSKILHHLNDILRIELPKDVYTVYVIDPRFGGGSHLGSNQIFWGHTEDWKNYNMVYLAHEYLHGIIPSGELEHCVIELATDNELRIRLNGRGEYFTEEGKQVGHSYLIAKEKELLAEWKKYLDNRKTNIFEFVKEAQLPFKLAS